MENKPIATEENKCECGNDGQPSHTCPYKEEICEDYSECNCCETCQRQCADDI